MDPRAAARFASPLPPSFSRPSVRPLARTVAGTLATLLAAATVSLAQAPARFGESPTPDGCTPRGAACVNALGPRQVAPVTLAPATFGPGGFLVFPGTRVAANGVSLRDVASGGIDLVGVPPGSTVVAAYLYWCWISLGAPIPGVHDVLSLARLPRLPGHNLHGPLQGYILRPQEFTGVLVGSGVDPCWNGGGNFVYRADVTGFVAKGDSYVVWPQPGAAGATDYRDPWAFPFPVGPYCEGASLVVVYTNPNEAMGTTSIYDSGLAGNMFLADPGTTYTLTGFFHPGLEARWIDIGADGQSGAGYEALHAMGLETTWFNGFPLAGPGSLTDSDWNGAGNKPLAGMWDTSGHDVSAFLSPGATSVSIQVNAPVAAMVTDCLVPVCNVLWTR